MLNLELVTLPPIRVPRHLAEVVAASTLSSRDLPSLKRPLLHLMRLRPPTVQSITDAEVARLEARIAQSLLAETSRDRHQRGPFTTWRRRWSRVRAMLRPILASRRKLALFIVGATFVAYASLLLVQYLKFEVDQSMRANAAAAADPRSLVNLTPSEGAQFIWAPALDPDSVPRLTVQGHGLIRVGLPPLVTNPAEFSKTHLRIVTQTELMEVAFGLVRVAPAADGSTKVTLLFPGSATIRGLSEPPSSAREVKAERAELMRKLFTP